MKPTREAPAESRSCAHCGTKFRPRHEDERFCCQGCAYAYELIQSGGYSRYYELKEPTSPVRSVPFAPRNWEPLQQWQQEREAAARASEQPLASGVLRLSGASCVGCVWLVERVFAEQEGAVDIAVSVQRGEVELRWRPGVWKVEATGQALQRFGYLIQLVGPNGSPRQSSGLVRRLGLCGAFAMNAMLFTLPTYLGMEADFALAGLFEAITLSFATASLLAGGSFFIQRAWQSLRRGVLHIDLPIALGIIAAYSGSFIGWWARLPTLVYFDFVAIFIFLMLLGRWLQEFTLERNQARGLGDTGPGARVRAVLPNGEMLELPREQLEPGQAFLVSPGDFFPVASRLAEEVTVTLEWINGESEPRLLRKDELAPAGAVHAGSADVLATAEEGWADGLLAQLLETKAYDLRDPALEHLLSRYLLAVLAIAALGGLGWVLAAGWATGLQVAISVLVVSCPCALGVAAPLAGELALGRARAAGVFVKNASLWRRLRRVRSLVFDKTGTLTLEQPRLLNPDALRGLAENERAVLSHLVRRSLHPVSRSLRAELALLSGGRVSAPAWPTPQETPGLGLEVLLDGVCWRLGRPGWAADLTEDSFADAEEVDTEFRRGDEVLARLRFADEVRDQAREQFDRWRQAGYQLAMLSGDRTAKVHRLADGLGVPRAMAHGRMTPSEKADWVARYAPDSALMLGDGLNDSLAFDAALCRGTPVIDRGLLEPKADFFFLDRGLEGLAILLHLARRHQQTVRTIFIFAVLYNIVTVSLCLAGAMSPLLAAILMPLSSALTILIASQLARA